MLTEPLLREDLPRKKFFRQTMRKSLMSISSAKTRMKSEACEKKPDRLIRKGVDVKVFFTRQEYNVCEKKKHPNSIFKDKASLHIYIIVRMVQKKTKTTVEYTFSARNDTCYESHRYHMYHPHYLIDRLSRLSCYSNFMRFTVQ